MAVYVYTKTPRRLLRSIREAIADGKIDTWECDDDGDFTHTPPQWERKAWLRPQVEANRLVFNVIPPRAVKVSRVTYGVYHGRFIEMLVAHFDDLFERATATALAASGDKVG
jgi:hypothetical protein